MNLSKNAQQNIGFEIDDLVILGATDVQVLKVREVLTDVIKTNKETKITFDDWRIWLMIFPSGLLIPIKKEGTPIGVPQKEVEDEN